MPFLNNSCKGFVFLPGLLYFRGITFSDFSDIMSKTVKFCTVKIREDSVAYLKQKNSHENVYVFLI